MKNETGGNSPSKLKELQDLIRKGEIDTVVVAFPDHYGQLMGKRLTGDHFLHNYHEIECCDYLLTMDIEMNPLPGFASSGWENGFGNYRLKIDTGTLRRLEWPRTSALVLGDLVDPEGNAIPHNPRTLLAEQCRLAELRDVLPMMASELEFYLFRNNPLSDGNTVSDHHFPSTDYPIDYHIAMTQGDETLLRDIRNRLSRSGISVESSKGETGRGQYEIALAYNEAMEMADRHIIFKYGIKTLAGEKGYAATFMAKYSEKDSGSSGHIHLSLFDSKRKLNLFWDNKTMAPSRAFRHFLGGMLSLTPELFLFFAPTVNSYKRFCKGSFAPTGITWGYDNRTTAYRAVGREDSFRLENRLPGADVNPYTAYAAMLAAGMYGIEKEIEPPDAYQGNAYQADGYQPVPTSLDESAELLNNSEFARSVFGDRVVDFYVHHARLEIEAFKATVTDWERRRYFDRI